MPFSFQPEFESSTFFFFFFRFMLMLEEKKKVLCGIFPPDHTFIKWRLEYGLHVFDLKINEGDLGILIKI